MSGPLRFCIRLAAHEQAGATFAPCQATRSTCSGCGTEHDVQTDAPIGGDLIDQHVCPRCQKIVSVWPEEPERCPECKGELEPWAGKVWFDPRPGEPEADKEECFEGPCPKCGTKVTLEDQVGPDGTITVTLWD